MTIDSTDEHRMLADAVARLLQALGRDRWADFAEMGLIGLTVGESAGGFGGGGAEAMIVAEALGATLAPEPFLSAAIVAASLLATDPRQAERLAALLDGRRRWTAALYEPHSRWALDDIATVAVRDGAGWRLDGRKLAVLDADADVGLLVSARTGAAGGGEEGVTLFVVAADAPGVSATWRRTIDGRRSAEFAFDGTRVADADRIGEPGAAMPQVRRAVDRAIAVACADAVGAMTRALDLTVDYLRTRQQFGQPIGRFQAVQHRAADMLVELEQARSMAMYAASMFDVDAPRVRRSAMAAAKIQVGQAARFVGQQAVQLHGGIGMSEEHPIGGVFKRLTHFERLFGDDDHFLREIDRCGGIGWDAWDDDGSMSDG